MEPKRSMSAFAAVAAASLALLALAGFATAAVWASIGLLLVALALRAEYARLKACGRRLDRGVPSHRKPLDRIVVLQWTGASAAGALSGVLFSKLDVAPLADAGDLVSALVVGLVVGSLGVYASSLVDWYAILPKVSGISGPAPCECAGRGRWKYTTEVWYFHRALATALVYLVATGIPAYVGGRSTDSALVAWSVVAGVIAVVGGYFLRGMFLAGWYAFSAPVMVGDQIYVDVPDEGDGDVALRRRRAYVLDVSIQGAKYKVLRDGRYVGGRFSDKDDGNVPNHKLAGAKAPMDGAPPLCPNGRCSGVNWYCRRNPAAHD